MPTRAATRARAVSDAQELCQSGFWVVDTELDGDAPSSLCALAVASHPRTSAARTWYFRPARPLYRWTSLHRLDAAALRDAPALESAFPAVYRVLQSAQRLVAYNAAFERRILSGLAEHLSLPGRLPRIHCALELCRSALSLSRYRLSDVCSTLGIAHVPHDVVSDATATAQVVVALAGLAQEPVDAR